MQSPAPTDRKTHCLDAVDCEIFSSNCNIIELFGIFDIDSRNTCEKHNKFLEWMILKVCKILNVLKKNTKLSD